MTTGQRIKAARKKAGLTQKELGNRLGISYQTLAQWENDLRNPKYETLQRIAAALNISADVLYGLTDEELLEIEQEAEACESYNSNGRGKDFYREWAISELIEERPHKAFWAAVDQADTELLNKFKNVPDKYLENQLIENYRCLNRRGRIEALLRIFELLDITGYRFKNGIGAEDE